MSVITMTMRMKNDDDSDRKKMMRKGWREKDEKYRSWKNAND